MTEWLIPCIPSIYDAEGAFDEYGHVVWHQQCNMQIGDVAYIYVTAPVKSIRCKCRVEMVDIPWDTGDDDGHVLDEVFCSRSHRRYMDLSLIEQYDCFMLNFDFLINNGLCGTIRSQRKVAVELSEYIHSVTKELKGN